MKQNLIRWGLCLGITVVFQVAAAQEIERKVAFDNYRKYALEVGKPTDKTKEQAILSYRDYFSKNGYRKSKTNLDGWEKYISLLKADGTFSDLDDSSVGKSVDGNDANSGAVIVELSLIHI